EKSRYFVFTMGLTESWVNTRGDYEYPMCPGTVAGDFSPEIHQFVNHPFQSVHDKLRGALRRMRVLNPRLRVILTVSPVPLTATMMDQHVIVSTMYSKSVLRAVAGQLAMTSPLVDYFPSYEIINSPVFKGVFFDPNQREVNHHGVSFVMDTFFECLQK